MATIYVATTGNDSNSGTSLSAPKRTIPAGISAASPGDTVQVASGTYSGNIATPKGGTAAGGYITVQAAVKWGAILVGNSATSEQTVFELNHSYIRLKNLQITGPGGEGVGARNGVTLGADHLQVVNCYIHDICLWLTESTGWKGGAAIQSAHSPATDWLLDGNLIHDIGLRNSTQQLVHGMYIGATVTSAWVTNNVIHSCEDFGLHPYGSGGGWTFVNNTIFNTGRGILTEGSARNTVRNNFVYNCRGGYHYDIRGTSDVGSNNYYGGTGSGITGASFATGGISSPGFVHYSTDTTADLHLTATSPLIGVGTLTDAPSFDADGVVRPQGAAVDVGAYEYLTSVPVSSPPGSTTFPYQGFPDAVSYPFIGGGSSTVNVSTSAALTTALANATAGQRIVLASGTYSGAFTITSKTGTSANPISVEASTTGGAVFAAGSTFLIKDSTYVTLKGLAFPYELTAGGNIVAFRGTSKYCRVTRCLLGPTAFGTAGTTKATYVYGGDDVEHVRVDHNELRYKTQPGNYILFDGSFTAYQASKHIRIDHNYIHHIGPEASNEKEAIRLGVSTMSKTPSYSVIERNRFEACLAEPEIVSVKACSVRVSGNTFYRCIGGPVYRHGTNGVMADNYVVDGAATYGSTIGSGGFRFYDANHEISYNYISGVYGGNFQGPLLLDTGDAEGTSTNLDGHWRVVNALVERNVLVGNPEGIRIGDNYDLAPTGCTIRDCIVTSATTGVAITQRIAPVNTTTSNVVYYTTPAAGGLTQDTMTIWRKQGYGPRLTFLQAGDVGIAGDSGDTDGTGALIPGTPGGGSTTPSTPTAPVGQTTIYTENFDGGLGGWNVQTHAGDSYSLQIVNDPQSATVLRTEVRDGDTAVGEHERAEISSFGRSWNDQRGTERWYEIMVKFGDPSWPGVNDWLIFFQWHQVNDPGAPAMALAVHSDGRCYVEREPDSDYEMIPFWTVRPGVWEHMVIHVKWETDSSGLIEIWVNDQQVLAPLNRKTMYSSDYNDYYVKMGQYRRYSNVATTVVKHDNLRVSGPPVTSGTPAPSSQTITVVSLASGERFGLPTITVPASPDPGTPPPPDPPGSVPTQLGVNTYLGTVTLGWTYPGNVPPPPEPAGPQTVSGAGNIASGQALGVPLLTLADGPLTIVGIGLASAAALGRPRVAADPAPAPAPGGVLVPALWAVGADGTTLTPLPAWTKITIAPVRNSPGAITVEYPAGAAGFTTLHDHVSAYPVHVLEIRVWLGGNATSAVGGWLVQKAGDDLTPGSTWTFTGHFHEWLLSKAIVGPQEKSTANPKGELRFAGATAGLILATMMDQAQSRGALPLVTRDWTTTADSNGQPWAKTISSYNLAPKTTLAAATDKLVELGMCEYEFTAARIWRVFNPGMKGTDRTTGVTPLSFAQAINLGEHSRRESSRDVATAVLTAGSEGFYTWSTSPTAQAQLGWRAESGYDAGQVSSEAGVQAAGDTQLEIVQNGVAEYNGAIEMVPGSPLPLIDYGIGDWAYTWAGTTRRKLRIAQIGVTFAQGQSPQGTVVLNDLITDKLTALYQRLNALSTGDAVVGTSTSTPGGTGEDLNPPAAPTGVVVSSTIAYRVTGESTGLALVSVGWAAVTTNAYADTDTAGKAQAASGIADRLRSGQAIFEDWTWNGCPAIVDAYNDLLLADWATAPTNPGGSSSTLGSAALTWLTAYPAEHQGGGAVTDDVAKYVVQYSYLGGTVVSSAYHYEDIPAWVLPRDPNNPTGSGVEYSWGEPPESPTTALAITFGDVTADRAISIRVAAVDRAGNRGPWSAIVGVVTAKDDTPPPAPSRPNVAVWFETMDITWDGLGSSGEDLRAAAPDLLSVEVHVSTGIAFIPDRPIGPDGTVDYAASGTYRGSLYAAGTWNVTDLTVGVTYFARLVAVDTARNASAPSETSDGVLPQQLVQIDIGPNAIGRQQIIDLEVVTGKIANLAVNDAKVSDLSVGKLTAGTMTAQVVLGGRFTTPTSNGNHIEIDSAGIRLFQGSTVVGHWQVFDASMMMTGQFNTATTGQRIVMNPGGNSPDSIRFYPTFTDVYSSIDAVSYGGGMLAGIRIVGSAGQPDDFRGMVVVRDQYVSLVHGRQDLSYWGSEIWVEQAFTRNKSATVDLIIDMRLTPVAGTRRVSLITADTDGAPIPSGHIQYMHAGDERPWLWGVNQGCGLKFDSNQLAVTTGDSMAFGSIKAASFPLSSSELVKRDIRPLSISSWDLITGAPAQEWFYRWEVEPRPYTAPDGSPVMEQVPNPKWSMQRFRSTPDSDPDKLVWQRSTPPRLPAARLHRFPIAEDLARLEPSMVTRGEQPDDLSVDLRDMVGVLWDAVGRLISTVNDSSNNPGSAQP